MMGKDLKKLGDTAADRPMGIDTRPRQTAQYERSANGGGRS